MRSRIVYTAGGMAINAKHRRHVRPAYLGRLDADSRARCNEPLPYNTCPAHNPDRYAAHHAKHRAEVSS